MVSAAEAQNRCNTRPASNAVRQNAEYEASKPTRFPTRYRRRSMASNPRRRSPPFYAIADWVIDFTDIVHPPFRMSKAIAQ